MKSFYLRLLWSSCCLHFCDLYWVNFYRYVKASIYGHLWACLVAPRRGDLGLSGRHVPDGPASSSSLTMITAGLLVARSTLWGRVTIKKMRVVQMRTSITVLTRQYNKTDELQNYLGPRKRVLRRSPPTCSFPFA